MPSYGAIASYTTPAIPVGYAAVFEDAGPWALFLATVLVVFVAVMRGDLVPRRTHDDAIHNGQMWQAAHMISEQARQEERDQKKELLEHSRLAAAVMQSLPRPTGQEAT